VLIFCFGFCADDVLDVKLETGLIENEPAASELPLVLTTQQAPVAAENPAESNASAEDRGFSSGS